MMASCRTCGHWLCEEHLEAGDGGRSATVIDTGLHALGYYFRMCMTWREKQPVRRPVDIS
jgi:hypothetical protein